MYFDLFFSCLFFFCVSKIDCHDKINVELLFECSCPFTSNFFIKRFLQTTNEKLRQTKHFRLYPFQICKTFTKRNDPLNSEFLCQLGPCECLGKREKVKKSLFIQILLNQILLQFYKLKVKSIILRFVANIENNLKFSRDNFFRK